MPPTSMKFLVKAALLSPAIIALATSCSDDDTTIGSSLIQDQVEIVVDSSFTLTGHPVPNADIQSRSELQLLGSIDARQYGTFSSDVVTQLMPAQTLRTENVTVDSVKLIMRMPLAGYLGDSLMPMGIEVFRLTEPLQTPIYSSFDPQGKYDASNPLASTMYVLTGQNLTETEAKKPYRYVDLDLGKEFGEELIERYRTSPSTFATPGNFAEWFPGLYIRSSFGSGRVVQVDSTVVTMFYHQVSRIEGSEPARDTTIYYNSSYLAVTPEIVTNNNLRYRMSEDLRRRADAGEPILVAPTGYDVAVTLPTRDIVSKYKEQGALLSVVNSLTMRIPVEEITNDYGLTPPPNVLLVKASEKDNFFAQSKLPDNVNSFCATYDSYTHTYVFNDMRSYILQFVNGQEITADDTEFIICPVTVGLETTGDTNSYYYYYYYGYQPSTTSTIVNVVPYIQRPAMARLMLDKTKIVFTYSIQNINF